MRSFVLGSLLLGKVAGAETVVFRHVETGPSSHEAVVEQGLRAKQLLHSTEQELSALQQLPIGHPLLKDSGHCSGITAYEHRGWEGWQRHLEVGTHVMEGKFNDAISSLKIPRGCWVFACKHHGCRDAKFPTGSSDFIQDVDFLRFLNDQITQIVVKSYDYDNSNRVMLYRDCGSSGSAGWFAPPGEYKSNLNLTNDHLSAIQVMPRSAVSLYPHFHFQGERVDLGPTPWLENGGHCSNGGLFPFPNDAISSLKIFDCSDENTGGFERPALNWVRQASGSVGTEVTAIWRWGYTKGDVVEKSSSTSFSTELTTAVTMGSDLAGTELSVSLSASAASSLMQSTNTEQSVETELLFTCQADECKDSDSEHVYLWSFEARFKRFSSAFPGSTLDTTVSGRDTFCSCSRLPPKCLPGFCADDNCQNCLIESPDPFCKYGVPSGDVCCEKGCGICGGTGCSGRPGGSSRCCTSDIRDNHRSCSLYGPPCVLQSTLLGNATTSNFEETYVSWV